MLIKIVILLLLFILIVIISRKKEGLIVTNTPINIRKNDEDYIYNAMTQPSGIYYDTNFIGLKESDVVSDMAYFNNASNILYSLNKYPTIN
jgi:hypothetical protein